MTSKTKTVIFFAILASVTTAVASSTDTGGFTDAQDREGVAIPGDKVGNGVDENEKGNGVAEGGTDPHGI